MARNAACRGIEPCNLGFRALQEAQDIFGVEFDFDDFEKYGDEYEEDEEEEDEDEYMDDETGEPKRFVFTSNYRKYR